MKKIFISYARRDSDRVYPITDILDSENFDIWIDKNDIPVGELWPQQIVQGIENADTYLIFISPASLESKNVINELTLAYEEKIKRGLQIIPIILTPSEFPNQARFQLTGIEWIDFSEDFHGSLKHLVHILGAKSLPKGYKKHLLNHLPGLQVTPEIITPHKKISRDIVIGKAVTIDHIRDQRFMTRKDVLAQALNKFYLHLQEHLKNSDPEILTFWIYGRSGSGKSVALLQVMQEIILSKNAQVIWLDDAIEVFPILLEKWANQQIDLGEPLFIFVDDFNAPHIRDRIDFKSIARLLRNPKFTKVMWPVLVTCSPPEYLDEFQATGNDEFFHIEKWLIPPVSKSEQKGFLEWFKEKTGETPKPSVAYEQDEGLILSMMFELRHGDMMEFARRFKKRLEGGGLLEKIAQPLALNRIYIWTPIIWFDELAPEQKDSLAALNLDQDFSIFSIENRSSKYIRLTHPHLSDVIYKAIRPDKAGYQRAEDLAKAFERIMQFDDVLASRILLAIAQGGTRISDDLNEKVLAEKMCSIWSSFVEIVSKSHPIGLAFIWTNLARWASRETSINNFFALTQPLDSAIEILGAEYYLWGDLWLQLWACYPDNKKLIQSGWTWIRQRSHFDETSWYLVWQTLLTHSEILPQGVSKTDLLQIGAMWLNGHEDRRWWSMLWQSLLRHSHDLPVNIPVSDLVQIGVNWLKGRENSGQWSFVWQDLLQHHEDFLNEESFTEMLKYGVTWLDGREDQGQWAFVWQGLIKHAKNLPPSMLTSNLINAGISWIDSRENQDQWSFVWQVLVSHQKDFKQPKIFQQLIEKGLLWIYANEYRSEWPIIYGICLARVKNDKKIKAKILIKDFILIGLKWIENHRYTYQAAGLALTLIRSYSHNIPANENNRFRELIKLMVYKSEIKLQGWPIWWLAYWELSPTTESVKLALKWMEVYSGNLGGAKSIINKLISTMRPDFIERITEWQLKHPQNPISDVIKTQLERGNSPGEPSF